jgi:SAM-dependent methyltransferase
MNFAHHLASESLPSAPDCAGRPEADAIATLLSMHRYRLASALAGRRRVLDFGCGSGQGTRRLAEVAAETIGMDLDDGLLSACESAHAGIAKLSFKRGGLAALAELPNERFDCITCFDVIEHLDEAEQAALVQSLARLLSPAGVLLLSMSDEATKLRHYKRFPDWRAPASPKGLSVAELRSRLEPHFSDVRMLPQLAEVASLIGLTGGEKSAPALDFTEQAGVRLALCGKRKLTLPAGLPGTLLPAEPHVLEDLLEREARLVLRIDALTADLLQARRDMAAASRKIREEHAAALAAVEEKAQKELRAAQQTIDALNQSLAIRATHVLDRWPWALNTLKSLGHRLAG